MAAINYSTTKLKIKLTPAGEAWFAAKEHMFMPDKLDTTSLGRLFQIDNDGYIEMTIREMREKSHGKIDHHLFPLFEDTLKVNINDMDYNFQITDTLDVLLTDWGLAFFAGLYRELPEGAKSPLENPDIVYRKIPTDDQGRIKMSIYNILCRTEIHTRPNRPLFEDEMQIDDSLLIPVKVRKKV